MFIRIETERWINDEDFDDWIEAVKGAGMALDGEMLKNEGKFERIDDMGFTKAHSVYRIIQPSEVLLLTDKIRRWRNVVYEM
jgi:hypothetical protein